MWKFKINIFLRKKDPQLWIISFYLLPSIKILLLKLRPFSFWWKGFTCLKDKLQKQPTEVLWKKSVLSNFAKFTEKYLCQSFFFNKVAGFSLSKERLWHQCFMKILWSFLEHHFYRTPLSDCFCHYEKTEPFSSKYLSSFINLKKILEWVKSQKNMSKISKFLCSVVCILNSSLFRKNINNTQVPTKLIALT